MTSLVGTTVADCLSAFSEKATQSSHRSTPLQKPGLSPAMMLPHSDLLLFVHGPPVPEEGAVAQHAGIALRPVLGLEKERGRGELFSLIFLSAEQILRFHLNSVDGEIPFHHLRVLAEREDGLFPVAVPHPGHFVAVAVQLEDGALPTADVPNEDRGVEAAREEPGALPVPCKCLYQWRDKLNLCFFKIIVKGFLGSKMNT